MSARMIRYGVLMGVLAACGSILAFAGRPTIFTSSSKSKIHWRTNLDLAHEEAVKNKKPMLVVFSADWCAYCQKMEQTTFSDPTIITYVNNTFVPVLMSLEDHYQTAEVLEVDRVPATVALTSNADLLGRVVGFVNADTYRESLSKIRVLNQRVRPDADSVPAKSR